MRKSIIAILVLIISFFGISCKSEIEEPAFRSSPTIEGRVMIPQEAQSDSVYILVSETGNQYTTTSDGNFSISGLSEDIPYTLYFSTEPFSSVSRGINNNGNGHAYGAKKDKIYATIIIGDNIGVVNIKKTGIISGNVKLEGESDFTGTDVFIPGTSYMAKTDGSGNYTITGVPEGVHRLAFMRDGFTTAYRTDVSLIIDESDEENIVHAGDVILQPATASIIGQLAFEGIQNSPYPAVTVTAVNESDVTVSGGTTTSDENGQFVINNLKDGTYTLQFVPSTSVFQSAKITSVEVKSPSDTLVNDIVIQANGGQVSGRITNSEGGLENATVLLENSSYRYSTVTGSDGSYVLKNVIAGDYEVTFMASGYTTFKTSIAVSSGQITSLSDISLTPAYGFITGKVFLEGQEQHSGITVTATSTDLKNQLTYTVVTGSDGSFSIRVDKAAQYLVTASARGYLQSSPVPADVTLGYVSELPMLSLKKNVATFRGNVQLEGAASFEGITILLTDGNHNSYTAVTDHSGNFIVNDVAPGTYFLQASKDGYVSSKTANFFIKPGDVSLEENVVLKVGVRSVTGNVTLELKDDHSGVTITATSLSDPTLIYSALSNSDGNYSLAGMKPGEYLITLSSVGYGTVTLETVNVVTDTLKDLGTVTLLIDKGEITGIVKLEGYTDHSGTLVELVGTSYTAQTDENGIWTMSVPSANYAGGVRFSHVDFETASDSQTITVLTEGAYSVPEKELSAIAITVCGHIDVAGTDDDSGARVYFDDIANTEVITDSTGDFIFSHIPLGEHTLIVERANTPTATVKFTAVPCPVLDLDTIRIIPNSSNIEGYVYLDSLDYFEGVTVSVETKGEEGILTTTTDSTGYYYIGNLISTGEHSVTFTKKGWDSQYMTVSGLTPLETKKLNDVTLVDTTVPVINSVRINNGASTAADKDVTIHVDALDEGSGISEMQVIYDESLDGLVDWEDYYASFDRELESGNGLKSVFIRVKDTAGNISDMVKAEVRLTDQKKEVSGVLPDDDLVWTKEMSPYLVVGNIMVEKGKTLTIEAGTEIQFAGPYRIQVEGTIIADGTEDEHIVFHGIEDGEGTWMGINGVSDNISYSGTVYDPQYVSGNLLRYVEIQNCEQGLQGNLFVEDSFITGSNPTDGYYENSQRGALFDFSGILKYSKINGNIFLANGCILTFNKIQCSEFIYDTNTDDGKVFIFNNEISGEESFKLYWLWRKDIYLENNKITGFKSLLIDQNSDSLLKVNSNSFSDCGEVKIDLISNNLLSMDNNDFFSCDTLIFLEENHINNMANSFYNSYLTIILEMKRAFIPEIDFSYNYWGKTNTIELNSKGEDADLSFIYDYYDDFDLTKIVYDDWLQNESPVVGYQGENYIAYDVTWDEKPFLAIDGDYALSVTDSINLHVESLNGKKIVDYRYSIDPNEIFNATWNSISSEDVFIMFSSEEAEELIESGRLIMQVRDENGIESAINVIDLDFIITGPAGGYIIYDEGSVRDDGWRFIEQSPYKLAYDGNGGFTFDDSDYAYACFGYFRLSSYGQNLYVNGTTRYDNADCTRREIGEGKRNTELLVNNRKENVYYHEEGDSKQEWYAPDAVYSAEYKGYDDWCLPSVDEAKLMRSEELLVTSSEYDTDNYYYVYPSGDLDGYITLIEDTVSNASSQKIYAIRYF